MPDLRQEIRSMAAIIDIADIQASLDGAARDAKSGPQHIRQGRFPFRDERWGGAHNGARQVTETYKWICGHSAPAVCAECYRLLAAEANRMAEEIIALRDQQLAAILDDAIKRELENVDKAVDTIKRASGAPHHDRVP